MPRKKALKDTGELILEDTPREYSLIVKDRYLIKALGDRVEELPNLIEEFSKTGRKIKYDRLGNEINETNPFLVGTYFFKSLNNSTNVEPVYTSRQLANVYNVYCKIIEEINLRIMDYQPTLTHFAKFAGMSLRELNSLKNSSDVSMRTLVERIYNDTFDANVMLSQHHRIEKNTTIYRMKVENEALEKKSPDVKVKVTTKPVDLGAIEDRLKALNTNIKTNHPIEGKYE